MRDIIFGSAAKVMIEKRKLEKKRIYFITEQRQLVEFSEKFALKEIYQAF